MKTLAASLSLLLLSVSAVADPGPVARPGVKQRLVGRIHQLMLEKGAKPKVAQEVAPLLASCKYPRVMTAIAAVESKFDPHAVGSSGEVSMFQVLHWPGGNPANNAHALKVAIAVFDEKLETTGSVWGAIRAYNGSGQRAYEYRRKVLALMRSI